MSEQELLPCDTCPHAVPLTARLGKIDARLDRIDKALFGDGNGKEGMAKQVETIVEITRVSRSTMRVFMWLGGAIFALITAAYQLKSTLTGLLH